MLHAFFTKATFTVLTAIASFYLWLNPAPALPPIVPLPATTYIAPSLGGFNPVQAQKFKLAGSGVISSATSIVLQTFKLPDASTTISMADIGTIGYGTLEPGTTKEEQISFTGVTQNGNGTATLTGVTRGLDFRGSNCTATSANQKSHAGGTIFILSNTACSYGQYAGKGNTESITGIWTFGSSTLPRVSSTPTYGAGDELKFVTYGQLASTSFSGTVNASPSQKGIIQIGTVTTTAAGTGTGSTGALLVPPGSLYNTTSTATTTIPVTGTNGKLSTGFIDQTANYTWSGTTTLSGTLNVTGSSTLASTTFSVIPRIPTSTPTTDNQAASTGYVNLFGSTMSSSSIGSTATANTTTSSTLAFTLANAGSVVYVVDGTGSCTDTGTGNCSFVVDIDGVNSVGKALECSSPACSGVGFPMTFFFKTPSLTAAAHTLKLTLTSGANNTSVFSGTAWVYTNK